jgi:hypothetical protein
MGMQENTHFGIGALFFLLFLLGLLSGSLYITNDADYGAAAEVMGICSVFGLLPAIIFFYFGMQLYKQRNELETLAQFLRMKQRATVTEVSQQYHWNDRDSEDKIVASISEGYVQGNFDRGTMTFYVSGAQAQMTFVENCSSCGAVLGAYVSQAQPAKCEFCGTLHPPPGTAPPPIAHPMAPPLPPTTGVDPDSQPQAPVQPPQSQTPPGAAQPMAAPPQAAYQQPPPQAAYQQPPPQAAYQQPPPQAAYQQQPPATAPPPQEPPPSGYDHTTQERKRSVKFMFVTATPNGMIIIAIIMIFFGLAFVGAAWAIGGDVYSRFLTVACGAVFFVPLLVGGGLMIMKSIKMDKYIDELNEVADYIVTFRKIEIHILARKMNIPEEQVRKLIEDILKYKLLEGQYTADGSEFGVNVRLEDQQFVRDCPYCKAPGINVQVIRGGSQKCEYCDSVIFFQEKVVS